jgi:hypothetical protein
MRRERGYAEQLPDVAVWLERSKTPGAVIAESGGRREDRQKMILEGWRDAVWSGRYLGVRYDCVSPSVARWIHRLAKKVGLTDSDFTAAVQMTAEQIAALPPAAPDDEPATDEAMPSDNPERAPVQQLQTAPIQAPEPREPTQLPRPSQHRRRSLKRPRPRRSASGSFARSLAWTGPSAAGDGAAETLFPAA